MNIHDLVQNTRDRERLLHGLSRMLELHGMDTRKASSDETPTVPYASHLLGVAALIMEHEGSIDQILAGLLHDALEDKADISQETLTEEFGADVAQMVVDCSDSTGDPEQKPPWPARKQGYIDAMKHKVTERRPSVLVSACDKLHNLTALVADVAAHGPGYLDRFRAGPDKQLWYYTSLVEVFDSAPNDVVSKRLKGQLWARLSDFRQQVTA